MCRTVWLAAMFVFLGYFSGASAAQAPSPEVLDLLRGNQLSELNSRYTQIQNAYKSGLITDDDLLAAFRVFYATDPTLESKYALWVQKMPNSYGCSPIPATQVPPVTYDFDNGLRLLANRRMRAGH
jgi:hypothetical protein